MKNTKNISKYKKYGEKTKNRGTEGQDDRICIFCENLLIFRDILGGLELTTAQVSHRSVLGTSYGSQMVAYIPLE